MYYGMTKRKVQKVGNSLMVCISPRQARALNLKAGDKVKLSFRYEDKQIIIEKSEKSESTV